MSDTISPGLMNQEGKRGGQNVYRGNRCQRTQIVQSVYSQGDPAQSTAGAIGRKRVYHNGIRPNRLEHDTKTKRQTERYLTEIVSRSILYLTSKKMSVAVLNTPTDLMPNRRHNMQNSTLISPIVPPSVLADHYTKLAAVSDGCGWTFAAWSFRLKAEKHLRQHEARLFCAAAERALVAYDVPFVSGAVGNVRPEQCITFGGFNV